MNFTGILVGAVVFFTIGICHPLVIKAEYHFGLKSWWLFLAVGIVFSAGSIFCGNQTVAILMGGVAFSFLWGIHEVFEQEQRVLKGWFPENPKRHEYYESKRNGRK